MRGLNLVVFPFWCIGMFVWVTWKVRRLERWTGYRRYRARCGHHRNAPCPVCGSTPDVEDLIAYRAQEAEKRP